MTFSLPQAGLRGIARLASRGQEGGGGRAGPLESALIREVVAAQELRGLELHAGQEPPQSLAAVVTHGGGVDGLGVLGVDDGGAEEAGGLVAGLEAQLGLVVAPRAVGDAGDRLAAGGHRQAQGQAHGVNEVPLRVVLDRGSVPGPRGRQRGEPSELGALESLLGHLGPLGVQTFRCGLSSQKHELKQHFLPGAIEVLYFQDNLIVPTTLGEEMEVQGLRSQGRKWWGPGLKCRGKVPGSTCPGCFSLEAAAPIVCGISLGYESLVKSLTFLLNFSKPPYFSPKKVPNKNRAECSQGKCCQIMIYRW